MLESWFLGFFEADGCFTYDKSRGCVPVMQIMQQDDMGCIPPANRLVSILFAGKTHQIKPRTLRHGYDTPFKPRWQSAARSKDTLLNTVWFFDQLPPFSARKQRDYGIWRKMALRYIEHGASDKELLLLADELSSDGRTKNKGR